MNNQSNKEYDDKDLEWSETLEEAAFESGEEKDEKRRRIVAVIKAFSMMFLALVVLVFVGIAWFSMNQSASADGMQVRVATTPFELAVKGENVGPLSYTRTSGTDESPIYTPSEIYDKASSGSTAFLLENGGSYTYSGTVYKTTNGSEPRIKWRLTDSYKEDGLGPNSQGKLTFYVIPKRSGTMDMTFSINMEGYTAIQDKNANGSYDVESIAPISNSGSVDEKAAVDYINGHILFFSGRTLVGGNDQSPIYSYTGFLDKNEIKLSDIKGGTVTGIKDVPIEVEIYWIWSNTFNQMVFDYSENAGRTPVGYDSGTRADIQQFVVDKRTMIFDGMGSDELLAKMAISSSGTYVFDKNTVNSRTNDADLTLGYNKADQKIGVNVRYLLLVLEAF